jgi:very-short-patch-repair endonuclease
MHDYARHLRKNATEAERRLWQHLRRRQLNGFKFRRQRQIGRYVRDFVCLEASVVIELDGSQHVRQSRYDDQRDAFLKSNGFACCASGTAACFPGLTQSFGPSWKR